MTYSFIFYVDFRINVTKSCQKRGESPITIFSKLSGIKQSVILCFDLSLENCKFSDLIQKILNSSAQPKRRFGECFHNSRFEADFLNCLIYISGTAGDLLVFHDLAGNTLGSISELFASSYQSKCK